MTMYELLPEFLRARDAEQGHPLRSLLAPLEREYLRAREDVDRLYDDWFVETCAPEVLPLLLDLAGGTAGTSQPSRALVANSIRRGRRKGTAAGLRRLTTDVTGWPAVVVEYFDLLCATQHLDNVRPGNVRTPDLRDTAALARRGTAHDRIPRSVDVRAMTAGVARHNTTAIGVHLWRSDAYPHDGGHARAVDKALGRWTFDPAGRDVPLFTPAAERLTRLDLAGGEALPGLVIDGAAVAPGRLVAADLSEWTRPVGDQVAVDPELGRFTLPAGTSPGLVEVSYHSGSPGDVGAHTYDRGRTLSAALALSGGKSPADADWRAVVRHDGTAAFTSVTSAAAAWNALPPAPAGRFGVIVVADSATYAENVLLRLDSGDRLLVVAAAVTPSAGVLVPMGVRPHLSGDVLVEAEGGELVLDGLSVEGDVHIGPGELDSLVVSTCTVMKGLHIVDNPRCAARLLRSVAEDVVVSGGALRDSIARTVRADDLDVVGCTVLDGIDVRTLTARDSILAGEVRVAEPDGRRVEHSHVAPGAVTPVFTSVDPAHPAFGRLAPQCPPEILTGAGDSGEMGVHHHLGNARRLAELAFQVAGHLRPGLVAGTCFAT